MSGGQNVQWTQWGLYAVFPVWRPDVWLYWTGTAWVTA